MTPSIRMSHNFHPDAYKGFLTARESLQGSILLKMKRKKKIIKKVCVYCGQAADSEDHIPSKNLIAPEFRAKTKFVKVQSCKKCNESYSKDEEFLRNLFVTVVQEYSVGAATLFNTKVRRSIEKRPHLKKMLINNMSLVEIFTPAGIFLGKRTKTEVPSSDRQRIFNVMDKYVKGLASFHFGGQFPDDYIIRHKWADKDDPVDEEENFIWSDLNMDTFIYGFWRIPESFTSIWIFIFFKRLFFNSIVFRKDSDWAKRIKNNTFTVKPDPF